MRKIITHEQVKKLTRGMPKKIKKEREFELTHMELCFNGRDKYIWSGLGEPSIGYMELGIRMNKFYQQISTGDYIRRNYNEIDPYIYQAVNQSTIAQRIEQVEKYKKIVAAGGKVYWKLKHLELAITEDKKGFELFAFLPSKSKIYQEKGVNGRQVAEQFERFIGKTNYDSSRIINKSEIEQFWVYILDDSLQYWEDFIKAVIKFDELLEGDVVLVDYEDNNY